MASSGLTTKQRNDLQAQYTNASAAIASALAIGHNSVAAALTATRADLQLVVTREQGAALT